MKKNITQAAKFILGKQGINSQFEYRRETKILTYSKLKKYLVRDPAYNSIQYNKTSQRKQDNNKPWWVGGLLQKRRSGIVPNAPPPHPNYNSTQYEKL